MAAIDPTIDTSTLPNEGSIKVVTWANLVPGNNVGTALGMVGYADRCIQVSGTFNASTILFEGSNDGTTYFTLHDPASASLSFTANGLKQVLEGPLWVRPNTNNVAGSNLTAVLVLRRNQPLTR